MNTTSTSATITGLDENQMYHIFAVARNEHGTSLPSSIIEINLIKSGKRAGVFPATIVLCCSTTFGTMSFNKICQFF